jgi:hypothetical protein
MAYLYSLMSTEITDGEQHSFRVLIALRSAAEHMTGTSQHYNAYTQY